MQESASRENRYFRSESVLGPLKSVEVLAPSPPLGLYIYPLSLLICAG